MSHKTVNATLATNARLNQTKTNAKRIHNALKARHNINHSLKKARNAKKSKKNLMDTQKTKRKDGRISQESNLKRRQANRTKSIVNSSEDFAKIIKSLNEKIQEYSIMQEIDQSIMCVYVALLAIIYIINVCV